MQNVKVDKLIQLYKDTGHAWIPTECTAWHNKVNFEFQSKLGWSSFRVRSHMYAFTKPLFPGW